MLRRIFKPSLFCALIISAACKPEAPPPPPPPPPAPPPPAAEPPPPAAKTSTVTLNSGPLEFEVPNGLQACTYHLKEVTMQRLGAEVYSGYQLDLDYVLQITPARGGAKVKVMLDRIKVDGRRDKYKLVLDSKKRSDMLRVAGGSDVLLAYDIMRVFALLDVPISLVLDERGQLEKVVGGDAARKALLKLHPPKPRTQRHYKNRVKAALSDGEIAGFFMPGATMLFKDMKLETTKPVSRKTHVDRGLHAGDGERGVRVTERADQWIIEVKENLKPSKKKPSAPSTDVAIKSKFIESGETRTVGYPPKSLCFGQAGQLLEEAFDWEGMIEEKMVRTIKTTKRTRIWSPPTPL